MPRSKEKTPPVPRSELQSIPFKKIHQSPLNPRTDFPREGIKALAATIEEDGLLEALMVRPAPGHAGHFEIAAGERRYRALEYLHTRGRIPADWPVPAQVRELDDEELVTYALVENLLREDLHPLDEAHAYRRLYETGINTAEIARRVQRSRRHVQLRIQLTNLAEEVQRAFRAGEVTLTQAKMLSVAPRDRHLAAFETFRKYPDAFGNPKHLMSLLARDSFPGDRAEFDPARYRGAKLRDPDTNLVYYLDMPQVLKLQLEAAETLRDELAREEKLAVELLHGEPSQVWSRYSEAPGRPTHGAVLLAPNGEITVFDHLVPTSGGAPEGRTSEPEEAPRSERSRRHDPPPSAKLVSLAKRLKNAALQEALAEAPETALKLGLVALLQTPATTETGLAFGPFKGAPPVDSEEGVARRAAEDLVRRLGEDVLPSAIEEKAPLERISSAEDARAVYDALGDLPTDELLSLFALLIAARVGNPTLAGPDAALITKVADELGVAVTTERWLRRDILGSFPRARLIRLALGSGAVPASEAEALEELTVPEIVERLLESDTIDPSYQPPELAFDRRS